MNRQDYIALAIGILILVSGLFLMISDHRKASSVLFTFSFLLLAYWNFFIKKRAK